MIEINLSPTKKAGSITNVGGIDLSHINVKMMVFAFLFMYIPESFLVDYFDTQIAESNAEFQKLNTELRGLNAKVRGMSNIQKQVDALAEQEKKLAQKLNTVKEIINRRQNPYQVMKYLVTNIPDDLWLESITLDNNNLTLLGYSKNWKSIGGYLEAMKNSIFFAKQIEYSRPEEMNQDYMGQRVEVFSIKTQVLRFK